MGQLAVLAVDDGADRRPAMTSVPSNTSAPPTDDGEGQAPSWTRMFTIISFVIGFVALAITIWSVGPRKLLDLLADIGLGFIAIIALEIVITLCDSAALSGFLGSGGRRSSYLHVVRAQVSGRAINAVTPLGSLGEATKATTLMERTPSRRAIAAVFNYNLASAGVRLLIITLGAPVCGIVLDLPRTLVIALFVGSAVAAVALTAGVLLVRRGMLSTLVDAGRTVRVLSKDRHERWRKKVLEIDRYRPKHAHQRGRWTSVGWMILSRVLAVVSTWIVLKSVGYSAGLGTLAAIATAGQLISMIASVVPMGLGISEGSNAALFAALGAPPALGVTMVLGSRVTTIMYAVVGLVLISASTAVVHTGARIRQFTNQRGMRALQQPPDARRG